MDFIGFGEMERAGKVPTLGRVEDWVTVMPGSLSECSCGSRARPHVWLRCYENWGIAWRSPCPLACNAYVESVIKELFQHSAMTDWITVRVAVNFLPEQSQPEAGKWFWVYHIRI